MEGQGHIVLSVLGAMAAGGPRVVCAQQPWVVHIHQLPSVFGLLAAYTALHETMADRVVIARCGQLVRSRNA